jgi:hypothetical protein
MNYSVRILRCVESLGGFDSLNRGSNRRCAALSCSVHVDWRISLLSDWLPDKKLKTVVQIGS